MPGLTSTEVYSAAMQGWLPVRLYLCTKDPSTSFEQSNLYSSSIVSLPPCLPCHLRNRFIFLVYTILMLVAKLSINSVSILLSKKHPTCLTFHSILVLNFLCAVHRKRASIPELFLHSFFVGLVAFTFLYQFPNTNLRNESLY